MNRRTCLHALAMAPAAALGASAAGAQPAGSRFPGVFCFFSKHLAFLDPMHLAEAVKDIGCRGVDLTVRPGGHVLPERATEDLPRAIDAIRNRGVEVPMITTALVSPADPTARPVLAAAAKAGVRFVKPGYWRYALKDVRAELAAVGRDLEGLARLASDNGVTLGFHNHASNVGACLWDIAPEIDRIGSPALGYYYDPRHAVMEGGQIGWKSALLMAVPRLKMVAVKDAAWERREGAWRIRNCPIGEGMVDWAWFARALADARFAGPVSLHLEYPIEGATEADLLAATIEASRRDLAVLHRHLAEAYA